MGNTMGLRCDGCGRTASPEHIARRLRRLEWATRYRPVHIRTLLLGAFAPGEDAEYLYAPGGEFRGEAEFVLRAVGIAFAGKAAECVQEEFQQAGYFLAHVLECPPEDGLDPTVNAAGLLRTRLPALASRVRRSLKPKCVTLITETFEPLVQDILALDLGCPVVLDEGKPFALSSPVERADFSRFRETLGAGGKD